MTEPYYQDDLVTLYHGDCLEIDAWLSADALVTDPPYGMDLKSGKGGKAAGMMRIANDEDTRIRDAALELWGLMKPALVFGRWNLPIVGAKQCLVWDKGEHVGMGDLRIPWKPNWEAVYVRGEWPERTVTRRGSVMKSLALAGTLQGERGKPKTGRDHATPKPVPLMESLVEQCPLGIIGEPFAGSGATVIAARNLGRKVIAVELEERHCETTANRLAQQAFDFEGMTA